MEARLRTWEMFGRRHSVAENGGDVVDDGVDFGGRMMLDLRATGGYEI